MEIILDPETDFRVVNVKVVRTGAQGIPGQPGPPGEEGPEGPQGEPGPASTFRADTLSDF